MYATHTLHRIRGWKITKSEPFCGTLERNVLCWSSTSEGFDGTITMHCCVLQWQRHRAKRNFSSLVRMKIVVVRYSIGRNARIVNQTYDFWPTLEQSEVPEDFTTRWRGEGGGLGVSRLFWLVHHPQIPEIAAIVEREPNWMGITQTKTKVLQLVVLTKTTVKYRTRGRDQKSSVATVLY